MNSMNAERIRHLIRGGESETVEFKSKLPDEATIARVLAAFANTKGGTLLIGVSDGGEVIGYPDPNVGTALNLLLSVGMALLPVPQPGEPGTPVEAGNVMVDGRTVLYACVAAAPAYQGPVLTSRGEHLVRVGDRIQVPSPPELPRQPLPSAPPGTTGPARKIIAFVAMSFREEEEAALVDYYQAILRAVQTCNLPIEVKRIDLEEGDYEISQRIMDEIDQADIVIADFTLNPRNVYFELGYARGRKDKYIIQTARKETTLEFDVRNWTTHFYRNATELERKLVPALQAAYREVMTRTGQSA